MFAQDERSSGSVDPSLKSGHFWINYNGFLVVELYAGLILVNYRRALMQRQTAKVQVLHEEIGGPVVLSFLSYVLRLT